MKTIGSANNQIFKDYRKLLSKKYRNIEGKYLIEGEKLVREAFDTGQEVEVVFLAEGHDRDWCFPQSSVIVLKNQLFDALAETESSQGILAAVKKERISTEAFLKRASQKSGNIVILDRVQDPGNIGTILRTGDAAGYTGVITLRGTVDLFSPKVIRAAAGALFRIPVLESRSSDQTLDLLRQGGKKIVSACPSGKRYYNQVSLRENIALIIGNEGSGISRQLMEASDEKVRIPMEGHVDSLNAAVAAGILMYEAMRK